MASKLATFGKFIFSVIICFALASIAHSQFVLLALTDVGVNIAMSDRIDMTISDLKGLALTYGSVILIAMGLGFLIINAISKWVVNLPRVRYPIAGALGICCALLAMQPLLNVTLIAGAREPIGFLFQCLAGLVGGWVFMVLTPPVRFNPYD